MPATGNTRVFPREDNYFKKKESLAYEESKALIWTDRPMHKRKEQCLEILAYILLAFGVGTIAFLMSKLELFISLFTNRQLDAFVVQKTRVAGVPDVGLNIKAWLWFAGMSGLYGFIASAMTTYWAPAATGSGVAELIGYLNGVNYQGWIDLKVLITKIIGVTFAVCGRLAVGKEGPLGHIGGVIGALVLYIPGLGFEFLRNDT